MRCECCGESSELDSRLKDVFRLNVCTYCASADEQEIVDAKHVVQYPPEIMGMRPRHRYDLVTKTSALYEYSLKDQDIWGLPHLERKNPHGGFNPMLLYNTQQVACVAIRKHGSLAQMKQERYDKQLSKANSRQERDRLTTTLTRDYLRSKNVQSESMLSDLAKQFFTQWLKKEVAKGMRLWKKANAKDGNGIDDSDAETETEPTEVEEERFVIISTENEAAQEIEEEEVEEVEEEETKKKTSKKGAKTTKKNPTPKKSKKKQDDEDAKDDGEEVRVQLPADQPPPRSKRLAAKAEKAAAKAAAHVCDFVDMGDGVEECDCGKTMSYEVF